MKTYIEIVRALREDKDLKQKEVADSIGATQQTYSHYETGFTEIPVKMLTALADFHDVSADYILGRTKCTQGIDALNASVEGDYTTGEMMSDILSLDKSGRMFMIECLSWQKAKSDTAKQGKKPKP